MWLMRATPELVLEAAHEKKNNHDRDRATQRGARIKAPLGAVPPYRHRADQQGDEDNQKNDSDEAHGMKSFCEDMKDET